MTSVQLTAKMTEGEIYPGEVVIKPLNKNYFNFINCNGALLKKQVYPYLYNFIGDDYAYQVIEGGGFPWKNQAKFNTNNATSLTWNSASSLPVSLYNFEAVITKNYVYLLGGNNGSITNSIYRAPINSDGTLGTWTISTPLPVGVWFAQAVITYNRVHLIAGVGLSTVYTAPINSDGTLDTWTTGTPLPNGVWGSQAIVTSSRVYLLGGYVNGPSSNIIHTAPINSDGTLGVWSTSQPLPGPLNSSQAVVTKNRVYLLGGYDGTNYLSTVYTAPINSDGTLGTWGEGNPLPIATANQEAVVTNSTVYMLGGDNTASSVYRAPINPDGTLGTWTIGTLLPANITWGKPIITSSKIFLLGGYLNGSYSSTVYLAPFTGGLNDYSSYYTPITSPGNFKIPDFTPYETKRSLGYFVKY